MSRITTEEVANILATKSDEELQEMFELSVALEKEVADRGPQTDDELHEWIYKELGLWIPRVAVCEGHDAPFDFIADIFFERVNAALYIASRGSGKTLGAAALHWTNSLFKPQCESCSFAAVEPQSFKAYAHLKQWIYDDPDPQNEQRTMKPQVVSSLMRETIFKNGSVVYVLGSTPEQVNGPHPQKAHADEVELMREDTYQESRSMTISKRVTDGRIIKPQDFMTSTRKGPTGRTQALVDEVELAKKHGHEPPRRIYISCIKETACEIPDCRCAPSLRRRLRLKELGRDPNDLCPCNKIRRGEHENGSPRLLMDICGGDFFKSRGWAPFDDVKKQFLENDEETFTAQQLCQKAEMKWHYLPTFSEDRHGIIKFVPDPDNGPIFTSVDWGGTNPASVHWYQLMAFEVEVMTHSGTLARIVEGTLVCFDEIYKAELSNSKLGSLVKEKEAAYTKYFKKAQKVFDIFERYADPQGKAAKLDWKEIGLPTKWHTTREFEEHIKDIHELFDSDIQPNGLFRVCTDKCPMFVKEAKAWRRNERTGQQLDVFNHAMSDFRYAISNIKVSKRKSLKGRSRPRAHPIQRQAGVVTISRTGPQQGPVSFQNDNKFDRWRRSLGGPNVRDAEEFLRLPK